MNTNTLDWDPDQLQHRLGDWVDNVAVMQSVDSTHACARRFMQQMDEEGLPFRPAVLIADRQTAGVGRGGRSWASPAGGLYMSWLRSGVPEASVALLPVIAAAAAQRAIAACGVPSIGIKWPNDLLVDGAKLGGLLVHARHGDDVLTAVSLGVNVMEAPILTGAGERRTECLAALRPQTGIRDLARDLVVEFVVRLSLGLHQPDEALERWRRALVHTPGEAMRVRMGSGETVEGTFEGVSAEGHVTLATADGPRTLIGGDILD